MICLYTSQALKTEFEEAAWADRNDGKTRGFLESQVLSVFEEERFTNDPSKSYFNERAFSESLSELGLDMSQICLDRDERPDWVYDHYDAIRDKIFDDYDSTFCGFEDSSYPGLHPITYNGVDVIGYLLDYNAQGTREDYFDGRALFSRDGELLSQDFIAY